jgi:dTDP-6-deoxy-L-talose 4-dehydrogenase (NAD+)
MRIAVTGASGFLGRHVLAELARRDVDVVATTRRLSSSLHSTPRLRWVELDVCKPPEDNYAALGRPDVLLHLAWGGLPNYKSLHHIEQELPAQYAFLSALVRQGLPALVCVGTCFEYGFQSGPLAATLETRPNNPYGLAKDCLRKQLQCLQQVQPFSLVWARLFYLYGEGQAESSLWSQLQRAVAQGVPVFNMSGGEQLRDYLPVTEAARQLVELACGGKNIGVMNLCSGRPTSVRSLVERWIEQNGWTIALNLGYYPYPDYEPMAFWGERDSQSAIEP